MKSIWDGTISFGLVNIPVNVFPATQNNEIHFHFLHEEDSGRIHNERVCDICGKKVPYSDIVKGFEYEKEKFVTLNPEDFEKVNPENAKTIDILDFVEAEEIDPMYFDKAYYVVPDKKGIKAYTLLREALKKSKKVGIAKLIFRTRENLAAIKANGNALMLDMMHFDSEMRDKSELKFPAEKSTLQKKELLMAEQLIDSMTVKFEAAKYKDTYEENLRKLIDKKLKGHEPKTKAKKKNATNVIDLMSRLKASLKQQTPAKKKKSA